MIQRLKRFLRREYTEFPHRFLPGTALPPLQVALTVTYRCNLHCIMCLQRTEEEQTRQAGMTELTGDEIRGIIRQSVPRVAGIGFCGGEIFLRKDIMDLLHFAAARNRVSLVTNGTLLTPEIARDLVEMGVGFMLFSVDGTASIHDRIRGREGTFNRVMSAIENVLRAKADQPRNRAEVHANCVVVRENVGQLRELVGELTSVGVRHLGLQLEDRCSHRWSSSLKDQRQLLDPPCKEKTEGMENLREIIEDVQRFGAEKGLHVYLKPDCTPQEFADYYNGAMSLEDYECRFPWNQIFVSPHADVYPCYMMKVGNLRDQMLNDVWNGDAYRGFRKALRKNGLFPQCYGCCFMRRKAGTRPKES